VHDDSHDEGGKGDQRAGGVGRSGKAQLFGFLVGQLMKETRGKANAEMANSILRELLGG